MALRPIPVTPRTKNTLSVKPPVTTDTVVNNNAVVPPVETNTVVKAPLKNIMENKAYIARQNPTLATRDNPMISVSTEPKPVDINTADQNTLLKEQDAINYKISTGSFTQDDFVRGREISRKLAESLYKTPEQVTNPYLTQLEAQAKNVQSRDNNPLITAKRTQLQANLDTRRAELEENARRARESTIGNIAMAGGGRSSVAQQAELDIQRELQNQLNAEQAAMNLEIMAYERELAGADSKELEGINQSINTLRTQAAQGQQALQTQSQGKIMEATSQFDSTLQNLARSRGIELDVNDEAALQQVINISRNPDGTVNEAVVSGLPKEYQTLVRAGVTSGVGKGMREAPKVERIGGTTKAPIYGYWDGSKFVTTNAQGVPTVRSGGGGSGGGGGVGSKQNYSGINSVPSELDNIIANSSKSKKMLPATQSVMLSDANYFPQLLSSLDETIDSTQDKMGPIQGRISSLNPYDTEAQNLNSQVITAAQLVGKFMEGGVLRAEDTKKYQAMLPQISDTPEIAKNKLLNVKNMLSDKYDGYLRDFANTGYNVSKFSGSKKSQSLPAPTTQQTTTPVKTTSTKRASIFN